MKPLFNDRQQAGEMLATALHRYANRSNVIVLALPRGGVPVAYEIARRLNVCLDVLILRKLQQRVDDFICLYSPEPFYAIGSWYQKLNQVSDAKWISLESRSRYC